MSKIEAVLHRDAAIAHTVAALRAKEADAFFREHGGTSEAADAQLERLIAKADEAAQAADAHKAPRLDEDEVAIDAPCPGTCRNEGVAEHASQAAAKAHRLAAMEIEIGSSEAAANQAEEDGADSEGLWLAVAVSHEWMARYGSSTPAEKKSHLDAAWAARRAASGKSR